MQTLNFASALPKPDTRSSWPHATAQRPILAVRSDCARSWKRSFKLTIAWSRPVYESSICPRAKLAVLTKLQRYPLFQNKPYARLPSGLRSSSSESPMFARQHFRAALPLRQTCSSRCAQYVALGSPSAAGFGLGTLAPDSPFVCQRGIKGWLALGGATTMILSCRSRSSAMVASPILSCPPRCGLARAALAASADDGAQA